MYIPLMYIKKIYIILLREKINVVKILNSIKKLKEYKFEKKNVKNNNTFFKN